MRINFPGAVSLSLALLGLSKAGSVSYDSGNKVKPLKKIYGTLHILASA